MKELLQNELYKILRNKWFYIILVGVIIYIRYTGVQFINAEEAKQYYPLTTFANMKRFVYPFLIILICAYLTGEELKNNTIQVTLIKGYNIKSVIIAKILTSICLNVCILIVSLASSYIVILPELKQGINLDLYGESMELIISMFCSILKCEVLMFLPSIPLSLLVIYIVLIFKDTIKSIIGCMVIYGGSEIFVSMLHKFKIVGINFMFYLDSFFYIPPENPAIIRYMHNQTSIICGVIVCILYSALFYKMIMIRIENLSI